MSDQNNVTYQRDEVSYALLDWAKVDDVVAGERQVKEKRNLYVPYLNPEDMSEQNQARNLSYIRRAYFFNATGRTLEGLIGIAFQQPPQIETPDGMQPVKDDTDGTGGNIVNQSHRVLEEVLKKGRNGLLVDYPANNEAVSVADQAERNIHSTILSYKAENIINWRVDSQNNLTLVVLRETYEVENDYTTDTYFQYRELRMEEDVYTVRLWRETESDGLTLENDKETIPRDGSGNPFDHITFYFVGATDNDSDIDKAPLLDLATCNLAHYRDSADYQDAVFFAGQPQIWVTGADEQWMEQVQKAGIYFGSRAIGAAPMGGSVTMLQAAPNMAAREAMQDKRQDMISLGARLMAQGEVAKTAEQSKSETAASHSVLSLATTNVSSAYTKALKDAAMYMNIPPDEITYTIDTDFVGASVDPNTLNALVAAWQAGSVPDSDHWANMRSIGVIDATKTNEQVEDELEASGAGLTLDG